MKVQLRLKHIKAGEPDCAGACPVALAILDNGYRTVRVDSTHAVVGMEAERYTLPAKARAFINAFDEVKKYRTKKQMVLIRPFTFTMRLSKS